MKANEVKDLMIRIMEGDKPDTGLLEKLHGAVGDFTFSNNFTESVMSRIGASAIVVNRESEYLRSFSNVFYRIALTGVAAILLLLVSIYVSQGTITFDTFLGITDAGYESIITVLTEN